jgi:hypothetical protein
VAAAQQHWDVGRQRIHVQPHRDAAWWRLRIITGKLLRARADGRAAGNQRGIYGTMRGVETYVWCQWLDAVAHVPGIEPFPRP